MIFLLTMVVYGGAVFSFGVVVLCLWGVFIPSISVNKVLSIHF